MSYELTAMAINAHIKGNPSMKLTLVALASFENKKTKLCNPSISTLALRVGLGEKQTRILLNKLKKLGYVSVIKNSLGGSPGSTCQYHIDTKKLKMEAIQSRSMVYKTPPAHETPTPLPEDRATTPSGIYDLSIQMDKTPPSHDSQTSNESIYKPSLLELEMKYGKYWYEKAQVVNPLIKTLGVKYETNEPLTEIGLRIKSLLV